MRLRIRDVSCIISLRDAIVFPFYDKDNPGISTKSALKEIKCNCVLQGKEYKNKKGYTTKQARAEFR